MNNANENENRSPVQENKMGTMPINRLLISMSVPMILSMLVQALYNIVDSVFVSKISESALTAVSLAFPVQNLLISVGVGTGVGVNALLSKSLGEKNQKLADKSANVSVFLGLVSAVIFTILGIFFSRIFFEAQTSNQVIINYGTEYLMIVCVCSIFMYMQFTFEKLLQSTGRTMFTMITQGTGAIVNIILDPIFIFGYFGLPEMGVAGAAIATITGQAVAAGLAFTFNKKVNKEVHLRLRDMRPDKHVIKKIYAVGAPSIIMVSIGSVMTFALNKILIGFSETATAVFGVYFKLQSFVFMPVFGVNNGMVPIIAYNYGAQKIDRIKKTIRLSVIYAVSIMTIGFIVFQVIPDRLLLIFEASDHMLKIGVPALRIISISFIFAGYCIISGSVFQSLGNGVQSLIISIVRQLLVLVPVAYVFSLFGDVSLVWWCFPIAEIFSVALSTFYLKKNLKKLNVS